MNEKGFKLYFNSIDHEIEVQLLEMNFEMILLENACYWQNAEGFVEASFILSSDDQLTFQNGRRN